MITLVIYMKSKRDGARWSKDSEHTNLDWDGAQDIIRYMRGSYKNTVIKFELVWVS